MSYLLIDAEDIPAKITPHDSGSIFKPKVDRYALFPVGLGDGCLYGSFFVYYDSCSITDQEMPFQIDGIRLSGFLDHLKHAYSDDVNDLECWIPELLLMRALADDSEIDLANLFKRTCIWFTDGVPHAYGSRSEARELVEKSFKKVSPVKFDVAEAIHNEEHFFLFSAQVDYLNFQFFLFDDIWAGTHPDLANSILKYCSTWDPFSDEPENS